MDNKPVRRIMRKYFSASYTDLIKFNQKPNEDFYLVSEGYPVFVVADGVTQSRLQSGGYAFPAGARAAAQIFCYTLCEFLEKNLTPYLREKQLTLLISKGFDLANERIRQLNLNEEIDRKMNYLDYDWFDTVGVVGFIWKGKLFYGYVGDCGLAVFGKDNELKFKTQNKVDLAVEKAKSLHQDWDKLGSNQKNLIMHRDFRNRADAQGYGSFTGEEGVKKYYQINKISVKKGDLVVFFSDGFLNYFQWPEFIEILRKQDKKSLDEFTYNKAVIDPLRYGTDRTLIAVIWE